MQLVIKVYAGMFEYGIMSQYVCMSRQVCMYQYVRISMLCLSKHVSTCMLVSVGTCTLYMYGCRRATLVQHVYTLYLTSTNLSKQA